MLVEPNEICFEAIFQISIFKLILKQQEPSVYDLRHKALTCDARKVTPFVPQTLPRALDVSSESPGIPSNS